MQTRRTISDTLDLGVVDDVLNRDQAFMIIHSHIESMIPEGHEFEYAFLDFGIQDGLGNMTQIMFSADVNIWSGDGRRRGET